MLQNLIFPGLISIAIAADIVSMRIWNWLIALIVASYFLLAFSYGVPLITIGMHGLSGLIALGIGLLLFGLNIFGGGDGKFIAANALWIGLGVGLLQYILITAILGGVLALFALACRRIRWSSTNMRQLPKWMTDNSAGIPYGAALGCAALWMYPQISFI